MKLKHLTAVVAIALALGCAGRRAPQVNFAAQYAGNVVLRLVNQSDRSICFVQISPAHERTWGSDWLGSEETIPAGRARSFGVTPGVYDIRALDCNQGTMTTMRRIDLATSRELVVQ